MASKGEAENILIKTGWGQNKPASRQRFASVFMPEGTQFDMDCFNELQRVSLSPENAYKILSASPRIDVLDRLPLVSAPTLLLHSREDGRLNFDGGRLLASGNPGAGFVPLEINNRILLESEPAWKEFLLEFRKFMSTESSGNSS